MSSVSIFSLQEFMIATDMTNSGDPEEKLRWAFKMYDKDNSGKLLQMYDEEDSFMVPNNIKTDLGEGGDWYELNVSSNNFIFIFILYQNSNQQAKLFYISSFKIYLFHLHK